MNILLKNLINSKVTKNGIWMFLLQGFNTIVPLITLPYITRILSPTAYGNFALALNWISYFQVIVEYGFDLTGPRQIVMRESDEDLNKIYSNIISARFILLIVCCIFFIVIIYFTCIGKTQIKCMSILFFMVVAVVFQQNWFFQGISEMQNISIINMISRTISVLLIFLLIKNPEDVYLYCFLYAFNYIVSGLIGCFIVHYKYKIHFKVYDISLIFKCISDGWHLFLSSAMGKIFGSIAITVLGMISTKEDIGIYSVINKIPYVLTILFSALSQTIYPINCRNFQTSYIEGIKKVKKIAIPILIVFISIGSLIIILRYYIVYYAFGYVYAQKSILLIPLIIWAVFGIINNFLGIQILVASGHQKEYSIAFQINLLIMVSFMVIIGNVLGIYGIAISTMISEIIFCVILYRKIQKIKKVIS